MKCLSAGCLFVLVVSMSGYAQQSNSFEATQIVNARGGPIYPITNVPLPYGVPIPIVIQGAPQAAFVSFAAPTLAPFPSTVLGDQLVDLDVSQPLEVIFDGLSNAFYSTDITGEWQTTVTLPESIALNEGLAAQTMVAAPSTVQGARLTAAHEMFTTVGITTISLNLADDGSQEIDLTPYGFTVPFYDTSYSSLYVTANGLITFESTTGDFTPTPDEFLEDMPRIAMFWTDLSPNLGGTVTVEIDQSNPIRSVRVAFDSVPEFAVVTVGAPHTFSSSINEQGDILITNGAFNPAPAALTCIQGISPGDIPPEEAIDPAVDFSSFGASPFTSQQNAPIYEWFGTVGSSNWTEPASNVFDLSSREISFGLVAPRVYYTSLNN